MEDFELLREYAEQRSEQAFAELVRRHVNLVYSTALRLVDERAVAEDVTQMVFARLAHKAGSLRAGTILGGWLYRTTRFIAETTRRTDWRRRKRETQAMDMMQLDRDGESVWKEVAPLLEQAMTQLRQSDQDAVLLRFFAGRSLREVGAALGISDDAAQKRVDRALDRLRDYFARRGVAVSSALLAPMLAECAVQAAPAALASTLVTSVAGAGGAGLGLATMPLLKAMAVAKLKAFGTGGIVGAVMLAASVVGVLQLLPDTDPPTNATPVQDLSSAALVLRGTVYTANGKPLEGALVRVATPGAMVRLYYITNAVPTNARVSRVSMTTARDGSFAIGLPSLPPEGKAVVVVTDDAGYALATADQLATSPRIFVEPWGRIEGVLRIGDTLGTNQTVNIGIWGDQAAYEWILVSHTFSVKTDANGRFVFPRVAPGDAWLTRTAIVRPGEGRQTGHQYVRVPPGGVAQVKLGGTGRALIGQIEWNPDEKLVFHGSMWAQTTRSLRPPRDWRDMSMEEQRLYVRDWRESPEGEVFKQEVRNYEFPVEPDGTFRVEDVLPGRYRIQVRANANVPKGERSRLAASVELHLDVPEPSDDDSDEAIDLGILFPKRAR